MKEHFCPVEQSVITYQGKCNWCGEKETLAQTQEPVGVVHHKLTSTLGADYEQVAVFVRPLEPLTKLYTAPPQRTEQEPWCMKMNNCKTKCEDCPDEPNPQGEEHMTPNTIEFRSTSSDNTWVMRITADRKIEVNEDVDVTFAAQKVLDAMQYLLEAQRTWVGLTDEEVRDLWSWSATSEAEKTANTQQHAFTRAIEAKLKEKNT
tara:strand:- start:274 stop:888 length:615 start_codon:yes stop_codon:yes gene_type:complete